MTVTSRRYAVTMNRNVTTYVTTRIGALPALSLRCYDVTVKRQTFLLAFWQCYRQRDKGKYIHLPALLLICQMPYAGSGPS